MRVALICLLLLAVSTTNLAVATDVHFANPVAANELSGTPGSDDPQAPVCQVCLHGPALTLLPQLPALPAHSDRPPSPVHPADHGHPAVLLDRIDEPPRSTAR